MKLCLLYKIFSRLGSSDCNGNKNKFKGLITPLIIRFIVSRSNFTGDTLEKAAATFAINAYIIEIWSKNFLKPFQCTFA